MPDKLKITSIDSDKEPEDHWYAEGLRFKCTECGMCCTGSPGYVWVTKEEIDQIATFLNLTVDRVMKTYIRQKDNRYALIEKRSQNFDCIFLKDKKCSIYKVRPKQCRTFPWWIQNLKSQEAWSNAGTFCEGINDKAPLIQFEEIQKNLHN